MPTPLTLEQLAAEVELLKKKYRMLIVKPKKGVKKTRAPKHSIIKNHTQVKSRK